MASKKDKLLENAQRFVLKGQIDKAIKEYQQIVALDPREIRFRQRLAELLVRDNRKEEAIAEYEDIGKHYADNSYFLKAIAVYKQIQRLDSSNPSTAHTLAVLNQRQGLAGNALAEYNNTVRLLEQQGDLAQAVKVAKEMLSLDAENSAGYLKLAELLFATGDRDGSYLTFSDLLKRLVRAGGDAAAEKVSARMRELFPSREDHEMELLSLRVQKGDVEGALAATRQALARNERNLQGWRLLCDVLRRKGETGEVQDALERMALLFPEDISVHLDNMRAHLERGEFARVAELLVQRLETFLSAGNGGELEALFLALPSGLRAEAPVQEALRRVYEASGDWEKLNSLRAPVLQEAPPAAPAAAAVAAPAPVEAHPAWEEEIDLDFEEELAQVDALPPAGAAVQTAQGLELEWPGEPEPFLSQQIAPAGAAAESADLPWGEVELPVQQEEQAAHEEEIDFFGSGPGAELELSLPEELPLEALPLEALQQEGLTLELELPGDDLGFLEQQTFAEEAADTAALPPQEPGISWEDVFPGCEEAAGTVDREDAESHYDLGIAYMEMGRFDAALKEFAVAAANPSRRLDCLILQAMSHRSKGEEERAEELLKKGLQVAELSDQEQMTLRYELAAIYEESGAADLAIPLYRKISAVDPSFRDVAMKLSLLVGEEPLDIIELEVEELI